MGEGRGQAEDESRRRAIPIKNDSRRRTRQGMERKEKDWKRRKTETILTREMELVETKLNEALLADEQRRKDGGEGE